MKKVDVCTSNKWQIARSVFYLTSGTMRAHPAIKSATHVLSAPLRGRGNTSACVIRCNSRECREKLSNFEFVCPHAVCVDFHPGCDL